ncbi:alcohol dehydrogenase catalytic domain-containing protein [Novosphingobium panipatense]
MSYPGEAGGLGHEAWGMVDAVGEGVDAFSPGDRVAALSYRAFAEYDIASAGMAIRLPAALDSQPFPGNRWAAPSTSSGAVTSSPVKPWRSSGSASLARC